MNILEPLPGIGMIISHMMPVYIAFMAFVLLWIMFGIYKLIRIQLSKHAGIAENADNDADANRPAVLDHLVMSEEGLSIKRPYMLIGRPDEVYTSSKGMLFPVDTKTRNRAVVFDSDIIQLSVYAVLLAHAKHPALPFKGVRRRHVARYGYIRFVVGKKTYWSKPVELLTEQEVGALVERRTKLEANLATPMPTRYAGICKTCSYNNICPHYKG